MATTYLSAKKAGYTGGSYSQWVKDGRPSGAISSEQTTTPSASSPSSPSTPSTPSVTTPTEQDQEIDYWYLDAWNGDWENGFVTPPKLTITYEDGNSDTFTSNNPLDYVQKLQQIAEQGATGTEVFIKQLQDWEDRRVDYLAEKEEEEREISEPSMQEIGQQFDDTVSQKMKDAWNMNYTAFNQKYGDSREDWINLRNTYASQKKEFTDEAVPEEESEQDPEVTVTPTESPEGSAQSGEDGDQGTIAEQNKTGLSYTTWAAQQQALGEPSSYQDWLNAPASTGQAETTADGQLDTTPVSVSQEENTTLALQQIDDALASGLLDQDTASLFKTVVRNWDVDNELNMDNVLQEFDEISRSTISPYFAEQADIFKKDVQTAVRDLEESRREELETQEIAAKEEIESTKEDLASRGLTFSSEAEKQLGKESAFGDKVPFGGEQPIGEGLVPTQNRLIASGSQRSYQQAIDAIGRQAEEALGQEGADLVSGFSSRGVTQGTIEKAKQTAEADVLAGVAGQENLNLDFQEPLDFNFTA